MKVLIQKLKALGQREHGFTLAELLVGLLVFGVLVSIAVPLFINQRNANKDNELKADLANAAINLESSKADNGGRFPDAAPDSIVLNSTNSELKYTYPYDRTAYCLQIISGAKTFFKSSEDTEATTTDCTYEYVVPSTKLSGQMEGFKPVLTWRTVAAATSYVIYKNNIPVATVSVPSSSGPTTSYTLPAMSPQEVASFYIVVQDGATGSPQSNSVSLTAPVPPPAAATIKIAGTVAKSSTMQQYTLQWSAIKYTDVYELWDTTGVPTLIAGDITRSATTYQLDRPRGSTTKVVLRSKNAEGTSPDSNELSLTTAWPTAKIISGTSNAADGKIAFVFQTVSGSTRTPDWGTGTPNSSIRLKITESGVGTVVFDQSGITTPTYTPNKSFERLKHTATIIVTTATGEVLPESAPIDILFPKPTTPLAVKNLAGGIGGTASISPNKLTWSAVACSASSSAEYYITHDGVKYNSGWISGTSFNIPQAWLAQGKDESFTIEARCINGNGMSANGPPASATFTTGIVPPEAPENLTSANRSAVLTWDAAVCFPGTVPEYNIKQTLKNGSNVVNNFPVKGTTYTLTGLNDGAAQIVEVTARCVNYLADGVTVNQASSWSTAQAPYSWTTPMPKPAAPTLTLVKKEIATPGDANYQLSWNNVAWAQSYQLFDASKPNAIATMGINTTTTNIKVARGTTMNVYIVAVNSDARSNNSNTVALVDTWPTPVILETSTDPYTGNIFVKWQDGTDEAPTPDWGTPGYSVKINVYNARTGVTKTYTDIRAREYLITDEFLRENHTVRIYVTTATGVELPSAPVTVTFPPPGPPAAVTGLVSNASGPSAIKNSRLVWNAAVCGSNTGEYLITNTDGSGNSGWITGTVAGSTRYFDLPQAWLKQGFNEAFTVAARCVNPNGASAASANVSVNFNASILTPAAVTGAANDGVDTVDWDHSATVTGLTREYKVTYVTKNNVASTESFVTANNTYTLTGLNPDANQSVYVQVRLYNPANSITSAWSAKATSNTTSWKTPKPVPATPVITLQSSAKVSTTMQRYTITWPAVTWTETYRLVNNVDGSLVKDGIAGTATSTTIDLKRGAPALSVALQAYNTSGSSAKSNALSLSAPWSPAVITTADTNRNGSANLAWQSGTYPNYTPDWGTPGYKVDLEIRSSSATGAVVYSQTGLTTPSHSTAVFAPDNTTRNLTYFAEITVTTATGDVLTSAWKSFKFERPLNPGRTDVSSDANGPGKVKNDRLTWDPVVCTQAGSTDEYYVVKVPAGMTYYSAGTDKKTLMNWTPSVTSMTIPQAELVGAQGEQVAFVVLTHCKFDEGDTGGWTDGIVNGQGYHEFTVGIAVPTTDPSNVRRSGTTNNTIYWDAAVCGTGTSPSYTLGKTVHNGAASTLTYTTTATNYALPSITAGANQTVYVKAKCIKDADATKFSADGPYSASYSYRAPLPTPVAPVITEKTTAVVSPTVSNVSIGWAAVPNTEEYDIYSGGVRIATVASTVTSYAVPITRGSTGSKAVYVRATNFSADGPASNTLTLDAPWPAAVVLSAVPNQDKQIDVKWQTSATSPDWGNPNDKVVVYVEQPAGTLVYTSPAQTGTGMIVTVPAATAAVVYIKVTTANNEVLTSADQAVNFIMPVTPAKVTNVTITNDPATPIGPDVLKWTAVTCSVPDTNPQYYVRQYAEGSTTTSKYASGWAIDTNTFTMPQNQLGQGVIYTYGVYSRCISGNGWSADGGVVQATAARTNVVPPAAPANFRVTANKDNGTAVVEWDAVTCPANLTAGYYVYYSKKNDVAGTQNASHADTNTTATLSGLTFLASHTAYVKARCYNADATSTWAAAAVSNSASWTTPEPIPGIPQSFRIVSTTMTPTVATFNLAWNASVNSDTYDIFNADTLAKIKTVTAPTVTTSIAVPRGDTLKVFVRGVNTRGSSANSNTLTLAAPWETPVVKSAVANSNGTITLKWQDGVSPDLSPDWGDPGYKVVATVTRDAGAYHNLLQVGSGWNIYRDVFAANDISGDGKNDIIAMNSSKLGGQLMLYNGNGGMGIEGNEGYYPPRQIGTGWSIFDKIIAVGDFDNAGWNDVIGRKPTGEMFFYKGYAFGQFSPGVQVGAGWGSFTDIIDVGDQNGDGKRDLVATKATGEMLLYPGNGTGGFVGGNTQIGTGWNVYDHVFNAGDQNDDGKIDLMGVKADGTMWFRAGTGSGSFASGVQVGSGYTGYNSFSANDFTGDAQADILMRKTDGTMWVLRGGSLGLNNTAGKYVYVSGAKTTGGMTTPVMPTRSGYSVKITVTTATGDVLNSASVNVDFAKPTVAPSVPSGVVSDGWGPSKVASNNRVLWAASTGCPTGSWNEYYVMKDRKNGQIGNFGESGWISGTNFDYPDSWLEQGSYMSGIVKARCANEYGTGPETAYNWTTWVTAVDSPSAGTAGHDGWGRLTWDAPSCPANTQLQVRAVQVKQNGNDGQWIYGWQSPGTYEQLHANQGAPQGAYAQKKCVGPNAESAIVNPPIVWWTAAIGHPGYGHVGTGEGDGYAFRQAGWYANCPTGTWPEYVFGIRDTNGNDIYRNGYWWSNYSWSGTTRFTEQNAAWGTGTTNIGARCRSAWAVGPESNWSDGFP